MKINSISLMDVVAAVVICGIVTGVVVPAVRAQEGKLTPDQLKAATCDSNLKQLALAVIMYQQDYDATSPSGANWYDSGAGWAAQVFPYVKSTAVFHCPADTNANDVTSYGYNSNLVVKTENNPNPPAGAAVRDFAAPADTVMLFEVTNNAGSKPDAYNFGMADFSWSQPHGITDVHETGDPTSPYDGYSPAGRGLGGPGELYGYAWDPSHTHLPVLQYATGHMQGSSQSSAYISSTRHMGKAEFAFADGHVKAMTPAQIYAGYNNPSTADCGGKTRAANTGCKTSSGELATFSIY